MKTTNKKLTKSTLSVGSALILAVVLTSLLAIVGVMFLMVARVDRMATSAISENRELNSAVETVIAKISQELVLDVPGAVDPNEEYYDYPDPCNAWLASIEPYIEWDPVEPNKGAYYWNKISDVTGFLADRTYQTRNVLIYRDNPGVPGLTKYIKEYPEITLDPITGALVEQLADADGDGIADSKWIELDDITSNKGKPIFAAIRIIDNGGMLNVNTAYKFDPNDSRARIDGSSQTQIDLEVLARPGDTIGELNLARGLSATPTDAELANYQNEVIWRIEDPYIGYLPFDISDELELRYRYCITSKTLTRLENTWYDTIGNYTIFENDPYAGGTFGFLHDWGKRITQDPSAIEPDRRHLLTTYNMDRIINPLGLSLNNGKMVNVNTDGEGLLYYAIRAGLYDADPNFAGAEGIAAQMAVNLKDYSDNDANVSTFDPPPAGGNVYYGFERPCVYISELAHKFVPDPDNPNIVYRSYAIELYKPYFEDNDPCRWRIVIDDSPPILIDSWTGGEQFYVIRNEDPCAPLEVSSSGAVVMAAVINGIIRIVYINTGTLTAVQPSTGLVFGGNSQIELQRFVADVNDYIVVDSVQVPDPVGDWLAEDGNDHSFQRDINPHKCIRRLWDDSLSEVDSETLGGFNSYTDLISDMIQAHPANTDFNNIGEIGMVFCKNAYTPQLGVYPPNIIGYNDETEEDVRIDVNAPIFQQIFNYLTVFDPADHIFDPNETRIKGRININTAPWYVIAQLPWMEPDIAQAVVLHRDTPGVDGFESIGELMQVAGMDYHAVNPVPLLGFPDLTPNDGVGDDFEERDVIFARISNLVTVRSDVFTAYILVRIGADGPQKRVIAILDRSNVYPDYGKVRIIALHPVPDPR